MNWLSDNNVKLDISILPYSEVTEEKFNEGLYDLYLSIDLFSDFNWEPVSKIGSSEIYAAVNNNRPDILQELNFAQKKLYLSDPLYNEKLREKYFSNSSLSKKLPLDEHYWIYRHQILNVGCLESEPQFYSINPITKEEKGLIPFIMNQIKEIFDLPNHKINYKLYKNMDEVDVALRSGEIDLFFPVVYDLEGAEKRGQLLSKKLLSNSLTLLYSSGDLKLTDLNNNLIVVAVPRGCRVTEYLIRQKIMDGLFFEYYDSHEACLQAVVSKNADIAIFSSIEVENLINTNKKFKKLYTAYFYDNLDYSCIVDKKNPELLSIVNKVISLTSSYEIDREMLNGSLIIENYTVLQLLKKYHPQIIFFIIFIIAIVSGLFFSLGHVQMLINYDVLTHLLNRRTLSKYMKIAMNKAKNQNECFSIMIFDLDNFKQINDNYGHAFGDEVLKMAAETISKGVKRTDYVFRWGGEEFLVLLKAEKNIAYKVAERIRLELEFQELYCGTEKISVTTTVGISSYNENLSEKELFAIADRNLYAGKNSGKNKVVAD